MARSALAAINTAVADGFAQLRKELVKTNTRLVEDQDDEHTYTIGTGKRFVLPATVKKYSSLVNFKGTDSRGRTADERAYRFGMWCMANYALNGKVQDPEREERVLTSIKRCKEMGIPLTFRRMDHDKDDVQVKATVGGGVDTKSSTENVNTSSGYLVPDEFQNDLIDLREQFGVFRRYAKIVPMASDTPAFRSASRRRFAAALLRRRKRRRVRMINQELEPKRSD